MWNQIDSCGMTTWTQKEPKPRWWRAGGGGLQPRKAPLQPEANKPEEQCFRQKEQQGWKDPSMFNLRMKASVLSAAHKALYHVSVPFLTSLPPLSASLRSDLATRDTSLFSEGTCLRAFAPAFFFFFFFLWLCQQHVKVLMPEIKPSQQQWQCPYATRELPSPFFNWSIVDLQCWVGCRYTAKGFSYTCIKLFFSDSLPL